MIQFAPESYGREAFDAFWRSLLVADWARPDGPLRLHAALPPSDLPEADFFLNARLFLTTLDEQEGAPSTATGNLSRVFVGAMLGAAEARSAPALWRKFIAFTWTQAPD